MRAILVSVDYSDFLSITLPYNRHHFESVLVVTADGCPDREVAIRNGADVFVTDAFYRNGASFNKWLALEEGLDWMGRSGWLCLMDADVLWPRRLKVETNEEMAVYTHPDYRPLFIDQRKGRLLSPLRHMMEDVRASQVWSHLVGEPVPIYETHPDSPEAPVYHLYHFPPEEEWSKFPIHPNIGEWAGYTQIFHSDDPHLGKPPWHEITWRHAGGADSYFQNKWPKECKVRTPWNVLHLGRAGENWWGRASGYIGGDQHKDASKRRATTQAMWAARRGRQGPHKYDHEKL